MDRKNVRERHFYYEYEPQLPDSLFLEISPIQAEEIQEVIRELTLKELDYLKRRIEKGYSVEYF